MVTGQGYQDDTGLYRTGTSTDGDRTGLSADDDYGKGGQGPSTDDKDEAFIG
jgi:hypothetical protein